MNNSIGLMLSRRFVSRCSTVKRSFAFWEDRSANDRVVTTAQWPVPYYNRQLRAIPVRGECGVMQMWTIRSIYRAVQ